MKPNLPPGQPAEDALCVQDLAVELGGRAVLKRINLRLPRGQILALLGPSGCGKTTLLRAIAGLAAMQAGQIFIGGQPVAGLAPQARSIGMMFQNYALFPNLSVRENIAFGPLAQGWSHERAQARTEELLSLIELRSHADQHPNRLSGGQRQRVALARALAPQPALLLMDEPFSAIDESFRLPLRRAFRQLQQSLAQSCVIVTHDREEAFELADQVAIMLDGRLACIDTPGGLLRQPSSLAAAGFLGVHNVYMPGPACALQAGPACAMPSGAGPWVAPISSLRPAHAQAGPGWVFEAEVVARYEGLRGAQLELRGPDQRPLQAYETGLDMAPGSRGLWLQPREAVVGLLEPNALPA